MVTIRKDYLKSRDGIIKYVEMGLSLLLICLSHTINICIDNRKDVTTACAPLLLFASVTCADGSIVSALSMFVTIVCLIGCIVVFIMRVFGYFFYTCEFYFLIVVSIGMLIGSIGHLVAAHGQEKHTMIFILSGALSLIVAILCVVDFVILKFLSRATDQDQQAKAAAIKSEDNSGA